MNDPTSCEERFLDCLLEEVEGRGPSPDLKARTLAALLRRDVPRPRRLPAFAAGAVAVLAIAVVVAMFALQRSGEALVRIEAAQGMPASPVAVTGSGLRAERQDPVATPQGPEGGRTIAGLVDDLADAERRDAAHAALLRAGSRSVPALIAALQTDPPRPDAVRERVLAVLEAMGPAAEAAVPAVARVLGSPATDPALLPAAARALATLAPFATADARDLAKTAMLEVAGQVDRPAGAAVAAGPGRGAGAAGARGLSLTRELARLLHRLSVARDADWTTLIGSLQDRSPYVRELAATLLAGRGGPGVVDALRRALRTTHPNEILATWPSRGSTVTMECRDDCDDAIHLAAARSLVALGGAEPADPLVHATLLRLGTPDERLHAVTALRRPELTGADLDLAVAALAEALFGTDARLVGEAATAIGILGRADQRTRRRLEQLAAGDDPQLAVRARAALRQLQTRDR